MSLYVNTNLSAMDALDNLSRTDASLSSAMQRLSSGLRINSAADDCADFAIVQGMTGQLNGVTQAEQNTQDGVSLVQTAQGALSDVAMMLQRVRELAVQYANGANSTVDQLAIVSEADQLCSEINRIGETAQFNGIYLLNSAQTITFQVGANDGEVISVATISLGAIADVSSAFGSTSGSQGGGGGAGYSQAQIQAAYEAAFNTVYGPNNEVAPTSDSGGVHYGSNLTFSTGSILGDGDSFGDDDTFAASTTFGSGTQFGSGDVFGPYSVFGADATFAGNETFSAEHFDGENQFGAGSSFTNAPFEFGPDSTFGDGDSFSGFEPSGVGDTFGSNIITNEDNDGTSWPQFLASVTGWTPAQETVTSLDTKVTSFLNSYVTGGLSSQVSSFITNFNAQLAADTPADLQPPVPPSSANVDISQIDTAINAVSAAASTFGAVQNRLSYTLGNSSNSAENLTSTTAHMQDVNMASEMTTFTLDQLLEQAGVAVLAQANHEQNTILTLLSAS